MKYTEAFKFPLHYDGMCYIYGKDNGMVIQFDLDDETDDKFRYNLVKKLNGEKDISLTIPTLSYNKEEQEYTIDGKPFMIQRGWGNLTSPNCLNLTNEKAAQVQDEFAEFVLKTLTT